MKKVLISVLTLLILVSSVYGANKISDYEKQLNDVKNQQKANMEKLSGVEKQIAQDLYDMLELDSKIVTFSVKLTELQGKSEEVNSKLEELEHSLQNSSQAYTSANDIYTTRLRAIYENGMPSTMEVFLTSKNISDFFSKINVLSSILEYDKKMVSNMQNQKEYIDSVKSNIEIQKAQLEQLTYDTEKSAKALDDAKSAKENKVANLQKSKATLEALIKAEEQEAKKIQEEINKLAYEGYFSGQFVWPTPGFKKISAPYGYSAAYFPGVFHTGIDIAGAGIHGAKIVAIESGVVAIANYGATGYGNYVVVDHGRSSSDNNTYKSLYGHASSLAVTKGQMVTRGQVIAYVGNTGNSTGPHLHFEIYKNNVRVDPYQYYKGM